MIQQLPALVTLLTVLLQFGTMYAVGIARNKYGIQAPAMTGHPAFERAYRVQMNTLESTVMFLPLLWITTHYGYVTSAGILGLIWVVGRIWYASAYLRDAAKRTLPYVLSSVAWGILLLISVSAVVRAMLTS